MVNPHLMKNGCGYVGNTYTVRHGLVSEVVGLPVDQALLRSTAANQIVNALRL
jgi:hypothetical protein